MIDAYNIINFNRSQEELEELLLFLIAAAGKKATTVARQLDELLHLPQLKRTPFQKIKLYEESGMYGSVSTWRKGERVTTDFCDLKSALKAFRFGCQTRLARAFLEAANSGLDLKTCSREDLMKIYGVAFKSANCFIAWTRKGTKLAMLDTHLLKFLRHDLGYADVPKSTPQSKKQYEKWEKIYLDYCDEKKLDPVEYDLEIWKKYSTQKISRNNNTTNS